MSVAPKIEASNLSIADLFKEFYSVPVFQREYVWQSSNVEKLLQDIVYELYDEEDLKEDTEYFLGSIVVFRDTDRTYQLIDGQQRLTTIYLIFCIIRDSLAEYSQQSKALESLISGVSQDLTTGDDINKYRLSLQYDSDTAGLLEAIANNTIKWNERSKYGSSSSDKILEAYDLIKEFIEEKFISNSQALKQFSSALSNKIKLIRIETPNLKNALKVFETINDRGVGLTSIDLLKNYLFISTSRDKQNNSDWHKLKLKWDKLMKTLYKHKEAPLRFLRYYIMSHYDVNLQNNFPEEDIYDWFIEQGKKYGIFENPLKFVEELITASEHYCCFSQAKNTDGSDNQYLKNIERLQQRYRQHFILLLSGRHLSQGLFIKLCLYVENLLFFYTITRSSRRKDVNITRSFSQWSKKLRNIRNEEQFVKFIEEYFVPEFVFMRDDFESTFRELTDSKVAKYRLRYILAKINQYIDEQAYSNSKPLEWYLNKTNQIEHILPQSMSAEVVAVFDKPNEYKSYVQRLGNLSLLEKTINTSVSDKPYEQKKLGYRESQIFTTRSLVEKPNVGNNTQLNRAIQLLGIQQFEVWSSETIDKRQEILTNIAKRLWGLEAGGIDIWSSETEIEF
ncbi:DUF262 domain-containing protein [Nodularia sphaerocarpa]|uniref:DUF262 domain-containing protein n=1 Tax=Nodularia sphaerocarpa TaxID=137816 RepID=UPI001EFBD8A3|nr:DUF262 domain-containing protein [Nodularia sphaerocarpa]MDB9375114.1 DUF262 domain-containing HNH endonuclease family protein [Nodularia sphaerocarpa CS-585]MDB9380297.1 DUF262 domain-containing HNH endonuclease family protein [Nodularia sphaerocarpa CS-585A2]ULP73494.1 hypothetical protein BDGGKGIB_03148 [Nodularia sphaerocarpa UHCC 0038]